MRDSTKSLRWIIDLINTDIAKLTDIDKWKINLELLNFVSPIDLSNYPKMESEGVPDEVMRWIGSKMVKSNLLEKTHTNLKNFIEKLVKTRQAYEERENKWQPLRVIGGMGGNPSAVSIAHLDLSMHANINVEFTCERKEGNYLYPDGAIGDGVVHCNLDGDDWPSIVLFQFVRIMEGYPIKVIQQCSECKKYYLHFTKHEKKFCSINCVNRHNVREWRKASKIKDPQKQEVEKQAASKRARKSYEKKVRKNHPNAIKIGRKPRKYHT